jgi:hypothetical protein
MTSDSNIDGQLKDLVADYADRTIDVVLSADVLREIPVVKTVLAGANAIRSIRDEILLRKLGDMLTALADVPQEDRRRMIDRLESDPHYARRLGEHLVELADRIESRRKPRMIGLALAAFARGQIDRLALARLVGAIERLPVVDLDTPRRFVETTNNLAERDRIHPESIQALVGAGLTSVQVLAPLGGARVIYNPNATCLKFVELNLDINSVESGASA